MKRPILMLALMLAPLCASVPPSRAADPAAITPVIEVKLQSIDQMLGYAKYVGGVFGQEEEFEQYANAVKAFAGKKGLEGFDTKRPSGLYSGITKDVIDSPVVLLLPVVDEKAVLALLKDKANLKLSKDGEVYETTIPKVPTPVFMKFSDGYLHVTVGNKATLDRVLDPKTFFAESASITGSTLASVAVHLDRIPADVKKVVLGQVEFQMQKQKDQLKKDEPSAAKRAINGYALDAAPAFLKTVLDDGQSLSVAFNLEPSRDDVSLVVKLTPKPRSALAASMERAGQKVSVTSGRMTGVSPILAATVNIALTDKWKDKLVPVVDDILNEADSNVDPAFGEFLKKMLAGVEPTMKSGDIDLALMLSAQSEEGKQQLHGFIKTKKIIDLVEAYKDFAKILPASIIESKFETAKVNDLSIHSLTFHENPEKLEHLFNSKTMYLGVRDDLFSFGFEPEGKTLKTALAATPGSKSVASFEVAVARFMLMIADNPDKKSRFEKKIKEIYGSSDTKNADTVKLDITSGDSVTIRLTTKGKTLRVFQAIDQINKE
ncbi:MAG: hypothetical protein U0798_10535 [Gemmataceae bacterium]